MNIKTSHGETLTIQQGAPPAGGDSTAGMIEVGVWGNSRVFLTPEQALAAAAALKAYAMLQQLAPR